MLIALGVSTANEVDPATIVSYVSCFANCALFIATVVSVICAFKAYHTQKERAKKETACDLAKYYAQNILEKSSFVTSIMNKSGITEYVKGIFDINDFNEFNQSELNKLMQKANVPPETVKQKISHPPFEVILACKVGAERNELARTLISQLYVKKEEDGTCSIVNKEFLLSEYLDNVQTLLNDLEWFSMCCKYGIADEELLYQSLHQTFLSCVWQLYYYMASHNESNENKYYTSIIWLFKKWYSRLLAIKQEAEQKEKVAKENLRLAQMQLENAQPKEYSGSALK